MFETSVALPPFVVAFTPSPPGPLFVSVGVRLSPVVALDPWQHGANPELRDRRNRHVEHWAYKRGHVHMVLVKVVVWLTRPLRQ